MQASSPSVSLQASGGGYRGDNVTEFHFGKPVRFEAPFPLQVYAMSDRADGLEIIYGAQ